MSHLSDLHDNVVEREATHGPQLDGDEPSSGRFGARAYLRWFWRQLTSMKVALILLLLLAIAAIPGSIFPQRVADPNGVVAYETDNPELFAVLDAFPLQLFDVYSSVWFSAIYILLFISLIGCVLPRIVAHWKALRAAPPRTPARLQRMVAFTQVELNNSEATADEASQLAEQAIASAEAQLKSLRYRTAIFRTDDSVSVSAERGYLRETGNLVFHVALVGLLVAVGIGGGFSYQGQKVVVEGDSMVNALIDYDTFSPGRFFDSGSLPPFGVRLDKFTAEYVTPEHDNISALGAPLDYQADVSVFNVDGSVTTENIRVNHPLRMYGAQVYLLANGYAPTVVIRNAEGEVVFDEAVPFIAQDSNLTSLGVIKVPFGLGEQMGLRGFLYPTKVELESGAYTSNFPQLENPLLTLDVFVGDLGINEGLPVSVFALDTASLTQLTGRAIDVESIELTVGETVPLPNELGTITLAAIPPYATLDIHHNPAQNWVLIFALLATAGLLISLFVPRRRLWVKALPVAGSLTLEYAALARGDDPTLDRAVSDFVSKHRETL
jgi:cytochrome c biogenesis protein